MDRLWHSFNLLLVILPGILFAAHQSERHADQPADHHMDQRAVYDTRHYPAAPGAAAVGTPAYGVPPPGSQPGMGDDSDALYHSYQKQAPHL